MQRQTLVHGKTADGASWLPRRGFLRSHGEAIELHPVGRSRCPVIWPAVFVCLLIGAGWPAAAVAVGATTRSASAASTVVGAKMPHPTLVPMWLVGASLRNRDEPALPETSTRPRQEPQPEKTPVQDPEKASGDSKSSAPKQGDRQKATEQERPLTERERMIAEANRRRLEEKEVRPDKPVIRRAAVAGKPIELTFDDIKFDMDKNDVFQRSMLTDEIKSYHGKVVRLRGFIRPGARQENLSRFVFVRDDKECCFGPGAAIYDCILVQMHPDYLTDFTVRPITLEGQFYLKEYKGPDGRVWAIYRMKNAKRR